MRHTRKPAPRHLLAITGTNGKTTTTHLLAHALRHLAEPVLTESTLGCFLNDERLDFARGASGFVAALQHGATHGARYACVEVTSSALARGFATEWAFDAAIFTNLTRDHLNIHGSWQSYEAAKSRLFESLQPGATAVLNACDPVGLRFASRLRAGVRRLFFAAASRGPRLAPASLSAHRVDVSWDGTCIELEPSELADELGKQLELRLIGEVFAENALAAALAAGSMGARGAALRAAFAQMPPPPGRFQLVARAPNVVVDFAHTPDALARTAETARRLAGAARVTLVFGAGGGRDVGKRSLMGAAAAAVADCVIVTTDNPRQEEPGNIAGQIAAGARRAGHAAVVLEPDRREAIRRALDAAGSNDVIVIAGRGPETEQFFAQHRVTFLDEQVARSLHEDTPRRARS